MTERDANRSHTLYFEHLDGDTNIGARAVSGATPAELAQAVHRHARGYLGSSRVDIHLDEDTLTGTIVSHGQAVGTFALLPDAPPSAAPETRAPYCDELRHGYTLGDLQAITRTALNLTRYYTGGDIDDRADAAQFAAVEYLYTSEEPPAWRDLVHAAWRGVERWIRDDCHTHGVPSRNTQRGRGAMPSYQAYWYEALRSSPSPENGVVDRLALWQIFAQLTPMDQEGLKALAATGDYRAAAAVQGVTYRTATERCRNARARFLALWHEGETPSTVWIFIKRSDRGKADSVRKNLRQRARLHTRAAVAA